ncbi:MAG TPA: PPE family protein [Mycobacterium sp.]|nr:PPE family protein [Mycobacterium sp.]
MDFGALPPEINSGRMYSGAGSGPMLAAAAAWDGLEAQLISASVGCSSVISELTSGSWSGPSSASMTAAAAPYVAWLGATAMQAEQTAAQARAAAAAYEAAFAMTVPPPVIEANRMLLMTLIATNFFGQNTPAIAATEAQYAEMWAQDATAMYHYAVTSAAATKVTPFTPPTPTTDPAGLPGQAAVVGTSSTSHTSWLLDFWNQYRSAILRYEMTPYFFGGLGHFFSGITGAFMPAAQAAAAVPAAVGAAGFASLAGLGSGGASVAASVGRAGVIGGLSVPPSWASASPAVAPVAATSPLGGTSSVSGNGPSSMLRGIPLSGAGRRSEGFVNRYGFRLSVVQRPPAAG